MKISAGDGDCIIKMLAGTFVWFPESSPHALTVEGGSSTLTMPVDEINPY